MRIIAICELHSIDWSALITSDTILQYNSWSDQLLSNIMVASLVLYIVIVAIVTLLVI